jgi:hypothetical protein
MCSLDVHFFSHWAFGRNAGLASRWVLLMVRQIITFCCLVGVILAILNVRFTEKIKRVIECDHNALTHIVVDDGFQSLDLSRRSPTADWFVAFGKYHSIAQPEIANTMAIQACFLPYVEKFDAEGLGESALGFESPRRVTLIAAEERTIVVVGGATPSGTEFYARVQGQNDVVFTVPNKYLATLFPGYLDLRSQYPFRMEEDGVLQIQFEEWQLRVRHMNQQWSDEAQQISSDALRAFTQQVASFYVKNYHGPLQDGDRYEYGVHVPDAIVQWSPTDGRVLQYELFETNHRFYLMETLGDEQYLLLLEYEAPKSFLQRLGAMYANYGN